MSRSELLSWLRSDWQSRQEKTLSNPQLREISLIVLHCSDTRPSQKYTLKQLQHDHALSGFGAYPGYHFYVRRDGTLYYCRPLQLKGCHVAGHNAHSIGVCYEGGHRENEIVLSGGNKEKGEMKNFPVSKYEDTRTAEQMITLHFLFCTLHEMFPKAKICGHHELNPHKACPCLDPPTAHEYAYIFG